MKNETNHTARMGMLLALTAIAALCLPPQVRAGGGTFYPTATNVTQLITDINYANTAGGAITITLAPSTTFSLTSADNATDGGNGLPVIGGTSAVNLTIMGNGDTIQNSVSTNGKTSSEFRLFEVATGASLTLDHVTLLHGWSPAGGGGAGGAIYNAGTLSVINGSVFSDNTANSGGGIYNYYGTVTISNSTVSGNGASVDGGGIDNYYGTVTIVNSTLSDNEAATGDGGGIYNGGTVTITNSAVSGNVAYVNGGGIDNLGGTVRMSNGTLSGNSAIYGGGIYTGGGTVTISTGGILTGNYVFIDDQNEGGLGGGICNYYGTVTVENSSSIIGNGLSISDDSGNNDVYPDDVYNFGTLYLDGTSTIGVLHGNSARGLISPMLSIASWSSTAHQLVLAWSTNYPGCTLQSATDPGSTNWTDCASPTVSGASFVVTNSMSANAQFFRLKQ